MQVVGTEVACGRKPVPVANVEHLAVGADQTTSAQILQAAVDVNDGETGGIGKVGLRQEPQEPGFVGKPDLLQAHRLLAQQVSDAAKGFSPTDVDDPFSED